MSKRQEVIAEIGAVICDALKEPNMREHLCSKSGCIQSSTGGGECLSRRQAKAVVEHLESQVDANGNLSTLEAIRSGMGYD